MEFAAAFSDDVVVVGKPSAVAEARRRLEQELLERGMHLNSDKTVEYAPPAAPGSALAGSACVRVCGALLGEGEALQAALDEELRALKRKLGGICRLDSLAQVEYLARSAFARSTWLAFTGCLDSAAAAEFKKGVREASERTVELLLGRSPGSLAEEIGSDWARIVTKAMGELAVS